MPLVVDEPDEHPRQQRAPALLFGARVADPQRRLVRRRERLDEIEHRVPQARLDVGALLVVRRVLLRELRDDRLEPRVDLEQRLDLARADDRAAVPGNRPTSSSASFWIASASDVGSAAIHAPPRWCSAAGR